MTSRGIDDLTVVCYVDHADRVVAHSMEDRLALDGKYPTRRSKTSASSNLSTDQLISNLMACVGSLDSIPFTLLVSHFILADSFRV